MDSFSILKGANWIDSFPFLIPFHSFHSFSILFPFFPFLFFHPFFYIPLGQMNPKGLIIPYPLPQKGYIPLKWAGNHGSQGV